MELKDYVQTTDHIEMIIHYIFDGKRNLKNFRALVPGCGTGKTVISLARQLKDIEGARVVAMDISKASLGILNKAISFFGLNNVIVHHESLLDLSPAKHGTFDFISCTGVLHHLDDPTAGLKALNSVLKDDGGMSIMVYGKYGRLGVTHMQKTLRDLFPPDLSTHDKLNATKKILDTLPETNAFKHNEKIITDHVTMGDVGLFDVLLHSKEFTYDMRDLWDWVESCNLVVSKLFREYLYDPTRYVDKSLLEDMNRVDKYVLAEKLSCTQKTHFVILAKSKKPIPALNKDMIPRIWHDDFRKSLNQIMNLIQDMETKTVSVKVPTLLNDVASVTFDGTSYLGFILSNMDGTKTVGNLIDSARSKFKIDCDDDTIVANITQCYHKLDEMDAIWVRHKSQEKTWHN